MTEIPAVGNQDRGRPGVRERHVVRRPFTHDQFEPAVGEALFCFLEALQQKGVVPKGRLRKIVRDAAHNQQGQARLAGMVEGPFQGGIVLGPLRLLHPVQNVPGALLNTLVV